jgi:hypothetical protein
MVLRKLYAQLPLLYVASNDRLLDWAGGATDEVVAQPQSLETLPPSARVKQHADIIAVLRTNVPPRKPRVSRSLGFAG